MPDNIQPRLYILTSDKTDWILPVTLHQIDKYWSPKPDIIIAGFTPPAFDLPSWALFYSIGKFSDYPIEKWSDGLIDLIRSQPDEHFIFFHEDYILTRQVDVPAIRLLYQYAQEYSSIIRIDLCTDRFYCREAVEIGHVGHVDLFSTPPPSVYRMSHQPSIFNSGLMLMLMRPGETPWQGELQGTTRLNQRPDLTVLGTRQAPIRHLIAINKGKLDMTGAWQRPQPILTDDDLAELMETYPTLLEHLEKSK